MMSKPAEKQSCHGVVLLDKPIGISSNGAMLKVRRQLVSLGYPNKAGYLGTLDPLASGVLPIFVGKATRLIADFERLAKTYRVTCQLGVETNTMDADGEVVATYDWHHVNKAHIQTALQQMEGTYMQQVPDFAAVKHNGIPAYQLARRGLKPPVKTRQVECHDLKVLDVEPPQISFEISCSAGTYMRVLVYELGRQLECGAHVTALRRLASGNLFMLDQCTPLAELEQAVLMGEDWFVKDAGKFLSHRLAATILTKDCHLLAHGNTVPCLVEQDATSAQPQWTANMVQEKTTGIQARAISEQGQLLAIGNALKTDGDWHFLPARVLI